MKFKFLPVIFTALSLSALAQKPIFYSISFPNAVHHEAQIVMTIPEAPGGAIRVRMSRSSAGRYATHEFGKNIYNVRAFDVDSNAIALKQIEGDVYEIAEHGPTVKISYTLYANLVDGTYAGIDESHAHLNMPAVLMWSPSLSARAFKVQFNDLEKYGWKVATQLKHEGASIYSARDLQYLMDSPTELSAFKEASWEVLNTDGKKETIRLSTHSADNQQVVDGFAKMVQKVVLEEKAVYGELPAYDYGEYTFLQDVYPTNSGDGMEHRNSTCIVEGADKIAGNEVGMLSTFAHEYFHSWNVKRIRPKTLEPFNFEHANMSGELWFAEGFTQYYGELLLVRAGFHTPEEYGRTMAGLVNSVLIMPAAARYSPVQMSNYAVFSDAGVSIDPKNLANIFTSYYYYGGATALALDLRLRSEFKLTLDDYMKQVWLDWGKPYTPYTLTNLQTSLAKVTKSKTFAADFFKRYIYGIEKNDYASLLAKGGFNMLKASPGKGWLGQTRMSNADGKMTVANNTVIGSPIYKAGIDLGDVIEKIDGVAPASSMALVNAATAKQPGDKITVTYTNRSGTHEAVISLQAIPYYEIIPVEKGGQALTKEQETFRNNWLSSKVK
jgi:predicted metalloprotease with PDZ domain